MKKVKVEVTEKAGKITRRDFLGFFLFGSFLSLFSKKANAFVTQKPKEALFWRKVE